MNFFTRRKLSAKAKFNTYYFLYCCYELFYGKVLLHNSGYSLLTSPMKMPTSTSCIAN